MNPLRAIHTIQSLPYPNYMHFGVGALVMAQGLVYCFKEAKQIPGEKFRAVVKYIAGNRIIDIEKALGSSYLLNGPLVEQGMDKAMDEVEPILKYEAEKGNDWCYFKLVEYRADISHILASRIARDLCSRFPMQGLVISNALHRAKQEDMQLLAKLRPVDFTQSSPY